MTGNLFAQRSLSTTKYADSLATSLSKATNDSTKSRLNFLLAEYWGSRDSVKAKQFLEQGRTSAGTDKFLQGLYLFYYGIFLQHAGRYSETESVLLRADTLLSGYTTQEALSFRARVLYDYGVMQQVKEDQGAFTDILLNKVIPLARQSGDSSFVGMSYYGLSVIFSNTRQFEKAAGYGQEATRIFKKIPGEANHLVMAYNANAEIYVSLGNNKLAKAELDGAYPLIEGNPESELFMDYWVAEAAYYNLEEQYGKAIESAEKGIALAAKLENPFAECRLQEQKLKALLGLGKYTKAREVITYLFGKNEWMAYMPNRMQSYSLMATAYAGEGNMKMAYDWQKQYSQLSDSFYQGRLHNDIAALEVKYKTAENQKKIAELETEKQKATLTAKNQRLTNWLLGIASMLLLIITAFSIFYYRNGKKLSLQKEINYQQQLKDVEQRQQLHLTQAMLEGEERERQRVARDLHDGLGGMLAGIKIKLSGQSDMQNPLNLDGVIQQLDNSVTELRRIARNMMPESLLRTGLETALQDLCESLMSAKTTIELQAYGIKKDIPAATQANIYRIVQEILSNAIRHAEASKIVVQCSQNGNVFLITVEDNGKGFDTALIGQSKGIGFSNIKSRVEYLNGKMDVSSDINEGATFNIELNLGA